MLAWSGIICVGPKVTESLEMSRSHMVGLKESYRNN